MRFEHSSEIPSGEDTIVRNPVIHGVRLIVMVVLEVAGVRMSKVEGHESVTIIDCIKLLAIQELLEVVLYNWALIDSSCLGSSCINSNAISKGKDVLEALVLKSVRIDINDTFFISNARV